MGSSQNKNKQKSKNRDKKEKKKRKKKLTLADKADKFLCYQKSVQSADHEIEFFDQAFHDVYRRKPNSLREDFCGTFSVCCEWVKLSNRRTAIGVDLCPETLQWGRDNNLSKISESQQKRITLYEQDVRIQNEPVDVLAAQNFSFWIFKTRAEVVEYFKAAHSNLNEKGVMVMDMMGGGECYNEEQVDKRTIKKGKKGFKYHWEQASFNPVNADASFYICLLYTSPSPRDQRGSRMPSSA